MNILDVILNNGTVVEQMAKNFNLDSNTAQSAIKHMLPALTRGVQNNVKKEGGLEGLFGALSSGKHTQYIEKPELLGQETTTQDGNAILGHLLGSKDVSRNVAGHAAKETGLDFGILKKMLPVLATVVMGSLGQQTQKKGILEQAMGGILGGGGGGLLGGGGGGGLLGGLLSNALGGGGQQKSNPAVDILGSFLDSDKDGSSMDDILGMAKKFF
ncbi:MAG: DUF937 domain-containing protein [Rhodothermales bacterium]